MGCDIHACVEFKTDWEKPIWMSLASNVFLWRDYRLFGAIAGVRIPALKMFDQRGFPEDADLNACRHLLMSPTHDFDNGGSLTEETKGCYQRWIADGICSPVKNRWNVEFYTDVDYHSYSWLSGNECKEVDMMLIGKGWQNVQFSAITQMMMVLEAGGTETRLIFAFDN